MLLQIHNNTWLFFDLNFGIALPKSKCFQFFRFYCSAVLPKKNTKTTFRFLSSTVVCCVFIELLRFVLWLYISDVNLQKHHGFIDLAFAYKCSNDLRLGYTQSMQKCSTYIPFADKYLSLYFTTSLYYISNTIIHLLSAILDFINVLAMLLRFWDVYIYLANQLARHNGLIKIPQIISFWHFDTSRAEHTE